MRGQCNREKRRTNQKSLEEKRRGGRQRPPKWCSSSTGAKWHLILRREGGQDTGELTRGNEARAHVWITPNPSQILIFPRTQPLSILMVVQVTVLSYLNHCNRLSTGLPDFTLVPLQWILHIKKQKQNKTKTPTSC